MVVALRHSRTLTITLIYFSRDQVYVHLLGAHICIYNNYAREPCAPYAKNRLLCKSAKMGPKNNTNRAVEQAWNFDRLKAILIQTPQPASVGLGVARGQKDVCAAAERWSAAIATATWTSASRSSRFQMPTGHLKKISTRERIKFSHLIHILKLIAPDRSFKKLSR